MESEVKSEMLTVSVLVCTQPSWVGGGKERGKRRGGEHGQTHINFKKV